MRKRYLALAGLLVLSASLCACGSKSDSVDKKVDDKVSSEQIADKDLGLDSNSDESGLTEVTPVETPQEKNEYGAVVSGDRAILYYEGEYLDYLNSIGRNSGIKLEITLEGCEYWYEKSGGEPNLYAEYSATYMDAPCGDMNYPFPLVISYGDKSTEEITLENVIGQLSSIGLEDVLSDDGAFKHEQVAVENSRGYLSVDTTINSIECSYDLIANFRWPLSKELVIGGISVEDTLEDVIEKLGVPSSISVEPFRTDSGEGYTWLKCNYSFENAYVYVYFADCNGARDGYDYVYSPAEMGVSGIEIKLKDL